jgi:prolyl oligopeptidase
MGEMMRICGKPSRLVFMCAMVVFVPISSRGEDKPPATPRHPVEDHYGGVVVRDDYRWLEDGSDSTVRQWSDAQNSYARRYLDHLPDRADILQRVTDLTRSITPEYFGLRYRNGVYFALKNQPPKQQPMLVTFTSVQDTSTERVLVDPNAMDATGATSIDFYEPSVDGSKVAVSLSVGGTEDGTVFIYEVHTGEKLSDTVPRVNGGTAGGSVAWRGDGKGFYHTRYPAEGERPEADLPFYQQVYYHALGTPATSDTYVIGKGFPRIAEILMSTSEDGRHVLLNVLNGDGGEHAFYLGDAAGHFTQVTRFSDDVVEAHLGRDALYLLSHKRALNGKILRIPYATPSLRTARTVVAQTSAAIEGFVPTKSRLYILDVLGGPSRVRVFTTRGRFIGTLAVPPVSAVNGIAPTANDAVLINVESYTTPAAWYTYDPARKRLRKTALEERSPASFADTEVLRVFARSRDGTRVPMTIMMQQSTKLDGTAPALLSGYGGYGIVLSPRFQPRARVWIDQGGILAIANLRGGGEYGEAWHRAGKLTKKQNVFDDFIACAQYLVDHHYTSPKRLAIEGGSNGGLLMGAALTQRPALFGAVVAHVGVLDPLRWLSTPNGVFNRTEFGDPQNPAQFRAIYAYSPYQRVKNGVKYPATLLMTGANDPRVDPANSRKMAARLQAATASDRPILLRTSSNAGHGIQNPLSERNEQAADVFAFLFDQLGVKYKKPETPKQ